ncbi:MAG: DNA primase [Candidatus Acididesulfobacter guangdongensis]|uniref:DNA primase n=1 Tax=Acididesulfobacter guangdongensis TaxID=2597225 RepID=A0A519BJE7_ACIG2|nr:MAG: DNA primase [Candidatus Acididesulfobacter guangdongensis]
MSSDIQTILDSVNIYDEVSAYVKLKKVGRRFSGLCPFHSEKTPSFNIDAEKGLFYCFGCGKGGNVINFLMDIKGESFGETINYLKEKYNIAEADDWTQNNFKQYSNITHYRNNNQDNQEFSEKAEIKRILKLALNYYYENLFIYKKTGANTLNYLQARGINEEIAKEFMLGYAPSNKGLSKILAENKLQLDIAVNIGLLYKNGSKYTDRFSNKLIIPIFDQFNEPLAFASRIINIGGKNNIEDGPKYVNTNNSLVFNKNKTLFGLNKSLNYIKDLNYVIVVEGYFDMISLYNGGIKNTVATMGTALSKNHILSLARLCDNIVLLYDGDEAGLNAINRGMELFKEFMDNSEKNIYAVSLKDNEDPDSFMQKFGSAELKIYLDRNKKRIIEFIIDYYINKYLTPAANGRQVKSYNNTADGQEDGSHEGQGIEANNTKQNYELNFDNNNDIKFNKEIILKKKIYIIDNIIPFLNADNTILFSYYINLIAGKLGLNEKLVREYANNKLSNYVNNKKMQYNNRYAGERNNRPADVSFYNDERYLPSGKNNGANYKNIVDGDNINIIKSGSVINNNRGGNDFNFAENSEIGKHVESEYELLDYNSGEALIDQSNKIETMILSAIFRKFMLTKLINESILKEFSDRDIVIIIKEIKYLLSNDVSVEVPVPDCLNLAEDKLIQGSSRAFATKFSIQIGIDEVFKKTQNPQKWRMLFYECQFVKDDINGNINTADSHISGTSYNFENSSAVNKSASADFEDSAKVAERNFIRLIVRRKINNVLILQSNLIKDLNNGSLSAEDWNKKSKELLAVKNLVEKLHKKMNSL